MRITDTELSSEGGVNKKNVMKPAGQPPARQYPPATAQRVNYEPMMNTPQQIDQTPPGHCPPAPPGQPHAWFPPATAQRVDYAGTYEDKDDILPPLLSGQAWLPQATAQRVNYEPMMNTPQ